MALGHALAAYECALTYATERLQFGQPLVGFQLIQDKLVSMLAEVTAMQLYCFRLARLIQDGRLTDTIAALAKRNNARKARQVITDARDILGGNGILLDYHVMRHMADIEALYTFEGTDNIQALIVGRDITGSARSADPCLAGETTLQTLPGSSPAPTWMFWTSHARLAPRVLGVRRVSAWLRRAAQRAELPAELLARQCAQHAEAHIGYQVGDPPTLACQSRSWLIGRYRAANASLGRPSHCTYNSTATTLAARVLPRPKACRRRRAPTVRDGHHLYGRQFTALRWVRLTGRVDRVGSAGARQRAHLNSRVR